jgi:hypothetical protein
MKTVLCISLFIFLTACRPATTFNPAYTPTNTVEKVYASQELNNRVTDIKYQTNWSQIPTSDQIIETIDSYVSPSYSCEHFPEVSYQDHQEMEPQIDENELSQEEEKDDESPEIDLDQKLKRNFEKLGGDPVAMEQALCFLKQNGEKKFNTKEGKNIKIRNNDFMVIQDFTKPSSQKRFFLINRKTGDVEAMSSAHGMGVHDDGVYNSVIKSPEHFSNVPRSNLTPRGFMVTSDYQGSSQNWGWHMKFDGIQRGINDNARKRNIVFHPGYKKSEYTQSVWEGRAHSAQDPVDLTSTLNGSTTRKGFEQGMTEGCTAVAPEYATEIYNKTKGGALYYNYTQTEAQKGSSYCGENIR